MNNQEIKIVREALLWVPKVNQRRQAQAAFETIVKALKEKK